MHVQSTPLKPLSAVTLNADEAALLTWIKSAKWEAQPQVREPIPYKAKVPQFFKGVRLYKTQAGGVSGAGAMGALDLFIKKLQYQGIISKQDLYPVVSQGADRFLILRKADLDNLGVGASADDEDEE